MNKILKILIVIFSLLLAAEVLFILLNPVEDATPTEPVDPTESVYQTGSSATETLGETQPTETADMEPTEQTAVTEPAETKPAETQPEEVKPTEPTEPKPTGPDEYDNTGSNIGSSTEPVLTGDSEYERYMNMSAEDQEAYFNSFASPAEFFDWYNKAKQEYEDSRNVIEVGPDATIDLGNIGN